MRSFWLCVLAFVVPLQTSWAAMHFCEGAAASLTVVAKHHDGAHSTGMTLSASTDNASSSVAQDLASGACCDAAHGCHGLHSLALPSAPAAAVVALSLSFTPSDILLEPGRARARLERPNWSAA